MPVPLIAAAGAAPAAVSGIKSGVSSVGRALGFGPDRLASGENRNRYVRHCGVIDGMYAAGNAAGLQALMTEYQAPGLHSWAGAFNLSPEARAYCQTKLDQLLARNRAAAGGGAPASVFGAGPSVAAGGDSYAVATANTASASAAGVSAGVNVPVIAGVALVIGALAWYFLKRR